MGPSPTIALTAPASAPASNGVTSATNGTRPPLPQRPVYDFAANADSIGLGAAPTAESIQHGPTAAQALGGSNRDVVHNRRAIRMANMSAAEVLKAELAGLSPLKPSASSKTVSPPKPSDSQPDNAIDIPGLGSFARHNDTLSVQPSDVETNICESDMDADGDPDPDEKMTSDHEGDANISVGIKRKFEEGPGTVDEDAVEDEVTIEEEEDTAAVPALKVNADGTVEQEDTVK